MGRERLVIIGGGTAGMSAASKARRERPSMEIIVIEKSDAVSTPLCGLPLYISGKIEEESLHLYKPDYFSGERNIDLRLGVEALRIDRSLRTIKTRSVQTGAEEDIIYDILVIASGAGPKMPNFINADLGKSANVFILRNLNDAKRIRNFIDHHRPSSAIVIGGGAQGLTIASSIVKAGMKVTILEAKDDLFGGVAEEMQEYLKAALESAGITLLFGQEITGIESDSGSVVVKTGEAVRKADMLFIAAGFRPSSVLAEDAGLALGEQSAVLIDNYGKTSDFNIYAAGDCATVRCIVTGEDIYHPSAAVANKTGYYCGINAAGGQEKVPPTARTLIYPVGECYFASAGLSSDDLLYADYDFIEATVRSPMRPSYVSRQDMIFTLYLNRKNGTILGAQAAGCADVDVRAEIDIVITALRSGMTARDLAALDLAYEPGLSNVYRPIHYAARKAIRSL